MAACPSRRKRGSRKAIKTSLDYGNRLRKRRWPLLRCGPVLVLIDSPYIWPGPRGFGFCSESGTTSTLTASCAWVRSIIRRTCWPTAGPGGPQAQLRPSVLLLDPLGMRHLERPPQSKCGRPLRAPNGRTHYFNSICVCTDRTILSKAALASRSSVIHSIVQFGRPSKVLNVATS